MGAVKTFDEWASGKSEELVHGTPGEDTSKDKGDEPKKGLFEINQDSCCSKDCQQMINEMYEMMCDEMKKCHGDESEMNAETYHKECSSMLKECQKALESACNKMMNRK